MPLQYGTTTISTLKYGTTNITTGNFGSTTVFSSSFTITFSGTYCTGESNTKTAYYGDTISKSGTTVTCKKGNTSTNRWTNTVTKYSDTAQYTYNTPVIGTITSPITAAQTISASSQRNIRTYTVQFVNPSTGSWSDNSSFYVQYGKTFSVSGNTATIESINGTKSITLTPTPTPNTSSTKNVISSLGVTDGQTVTSNLTITPTMTTGTKAYYKQVYLWKTYKSSGWSVKWQSSQTSGANITFSLVITGVGTYSIGNNTTGVNSANDNALAVKDAAGNTLYSGTVDDLNTTKTEILYVYSDSTTNFS